jgi:hypothetical protein
MSSIIRLRNGVIEVVLLRENRHALPALEYYLDHPALPAASRSYGEAVQSKEHSVI